MISRMSATKKFCVVSAKIKVENDFAREREKKNLGVSTFKIKVENGKKKYGGFPPSKIKVENSTLNYVTWKTFPPLKIYGGNQENAFS